MAVDSEGGGSGEPIGMQLLFRNVLFSQLQQVVEEATDENVDDPHFPHPHRIQEKDQLSAWRKGENDNTLEDSKLYLFG